MDADQCRSWKRATMDIMMVGGLSHSCCSIRMVAVFAEEGDSASVLVVCDRLQGFNLLLGIDAIKALGGIALGPSGQIQIGDRGIAKCAAITINEPDFTATFDHQSKVWTVVWKWSEDRVPEGRQNGVSEYPVATEILVDYEQDLRTWISNEEKLGPPKGLIPLIAVLQQNKSKVCPVMDFLELNYHLDVFTTNADVCASKLCELQQEGSNMSLLDLRRAYLQIHVHKSLAILDHESWLEKIMPDISGIQSECGSSNHEVYHQHGAGLRRNHGPCVIHIQRRHLYQWGCCACDLCQRTSSSVWAGMQRPGMVRGWRMSAGTGSCDGTRWTAMEARKRGSQRHATCIILFVWEACWVPSSVWLALCGLRDTQDKSKFSHKGLGWQNKGCFPPVHDVWEPGLCTAGRSSSWGLLRGQPGAEHVGQCRFSNDQSGFGKTWNCAGWCLLAATREQRPRYQPHWAGRHIERRSFSSLVAEQGTTCEDRFCIWHPD